MHLRARACIMVIYVAKQYISRNILQLHCRNLHAREPHLRYLTQVCLIRVDQVEMYFNWKNRNWKSAESCVLHLIL